MEKAIKFQDVAHLYVPFHYMSLMDSVPSGVCTSVQRHDDLDFYDLEFEDGDDLITIPTNNFDKVIPLLRKISDITDGELTFIGKELCAIPNHPAKDFDWKIQRTHNTVGILYTSPSYTSPQSFSIWNEKNGVDKVGHIEVSWHRRIDKRKERENWRVSSMHRVTVLLLKFNIDIFGLINTKQALELYK